MKSFSLFTSLILLISPVVLLEGCSSKKTVADMAFLQNVPVYETKQIDDALNQVKFSFKEPTTLPFVVTSAKAYVTEPFKNVQHVDLLFISNDKRAIDLTVDKSETSLENVETRKRQMTKLSNGTEAVYGNNDSSSSLIWVKDGITYALSSSKDENGKGVSDLSLTDLVKVADTFK